LAFCCGLYQNTLVRTGQLCAKHRNEHKNDDDREYEPRHSAGGGLFAKGALA